MIINDLEQFKSIMEKVLDTEGVIAFCKKCPVHIRCCEQFSQLNCNYVATKSDCGNDKQLRCYFYICSVLEDSDDNNKRVHNWLKKLRQQISWPNKLEFPIEIEEFKGIENETHN